MQRAAARINTKLRPLPTRSLLALIPSIACLATLWLLAAGCSSPFAKKEATTLRLHLETNPDASGRSVQIPIYRASPIYVNVEKNEFLTEGSVENASVVEAIGGFEIRIQFNRHGSHVLDQVSSAYRGRRIAVFSQFGDARWLAAPRMTDRIQDGVLQFTPDATREEVERIVLGLNNIAEHVRNQEP